MSTMCLNLLIYQHANLNSGSTRCIWHTNKLWGSILYEFF